MKNNSTMEIPSQINACNIFIFFNLLQRVKWSPIMAIRNKSTENHQRRNIITLLSKGRNFKECHACYGKNTCFDFKEATCHMQVFD